MTTYSTGNPVGSPAPKDLYDNAENLDTALHTGENTWVDRLGNTRTSWSGATGYQILGDYAGGVEITERNQIVREGGEYWRLKGSVDLPYTTTGTWGGDDEDLFVSVGDAVLRSELAADGGVFLVKDAVAKVANVTELRALTGLVDGQAVEITGTGRAGLFVAVGEAGDFASEIASDPEEGIYVVTADSRVMKRSGNFNLSPQMFGAVSGEASGQSTAINAWASAFRDFDIKSGVCIGDFELDGKVTIDVGDFKNLLIDATFTANYTSDDHIVEVINSQKLILLGKINVFGGGATAATRTNGKGILFDGDFHGQIQRVEVRNVKHNGVEIRNNSGFCTFMRFDAIQAYLCGHSQSGGGAGFSANWDNRVDTGSSSLPNQYSTIDVDAMPDIVEQGDWVKIGDEPHYISSVDEVNGTITVYPWIEIGETFGTLDFYTGSGLSILGADSGGIAIGTVSALLCGIGATQRALYPGEIEFFSNEFCGVGFVLGGAPGTPVLGGGIGTHYSEATDFNFIRATTYAASGFSVRSVADASDGGKNLALSPLSSGGVKNPSYSAMQGVSIANSGGYTVSAPQSARTPVGFGSGSVKLGAGGNPCHTFRKDAVTLTLQDDASRTSFAQDQMSITVVGTAASGAPSGTVTIQCEAGYTVNGVSSVAFSSLDGPVFIHAYLSGTAWEVRKISPVGGTATESFAGASVAAGAVETVDVTATGSTITDFAQASYSAGTGGLIIGAKILTAGTCRVSFFNPTGGSISIPSGNVRVRWV